MTCEALKTAARFMLVERGGVGEGEEELNKGHLGRISTRENQRCNATTEIRNPDHGHVQWIE